MKLINYLNKNHNSLKNPGLVLELETPTPSVIHAELWLHNQQQMGWCIWLNSTLDPFSNDKSFDHSFYRLGVLGNLDIAEISDVAGEGEYVTDSKSKFNVAFCFDDIFHDSVTAQKAQKLIAVLNGAISELIEASFSDIEGYDYIGDGVTRFKGRLSIS